MAGLQVQVEKQIISVSYSSSIFILLLSFKHGYKSVITQIEPCLITLNMKPRYTVESKIEYSHSKTSISSRKKWIVECQSLYAKKRERQ